MTHFSPFLSPVQPHFHLLALPLRQFSVFPSLSFSSLVRPYAAEPTLAALPHPVILQKKLSPPLPLLCYSFSSFSHPLLYLSPLPALTSAPFIPLSTPSQSSRTPQKPTASSTSCHRLVHVHPFLSLRLELITQFSSKTLLLFAYEHILKSQPETHSAPATLIFHTISICNKVQTFSTSFSYAYGLSRLDCRSR